MKSVYCITIFARHPWPWSVTPGLDNVAWQVNPIYNTCMLCYYRKFHPLLYVSKIANKANLKMQALICVHAMCTLLHACACGFKALGLGPHPKTQPQLHKTSSYAGSCMLCEWVETIIIIAHWRCTLHITGIIHWINIWIVALWMLWWKKETT